MPTYTHNTIICMHTINIVAMKLNWNSIPLNNYTLFTWSSVHRSRNRYACNINIGQVPWKLVAFSISTVITLASAKNIAVWPTLYGVFYITYMICGRTGLWGSYYVVLEFPLNCHNPAGVPCVRILGRYSPGGWPLLSSCCFPILMPMAVQKTVVTFPIFPRVPIYILFNYNSLPNQATFESSAAIHRNNMLTV